MKIKLLLLLFVLINSDLIAQKSNLVYKTIRISQAPKIDGVMNDEAWQNAEILSGFTQNIPDEGKPITQKTEARIVYDNSAIYIAAMLYDSHPDSILRELGVRDAILSADLFRFCIDPYNNQQDAYYFEVYSSGVQRDYKLTDALFDAVWHSKTQITNEGWSVEIKIPYSAIRFPSQSQQEWGLQVTRTIERRKEFAQWALTPKSVSNVLPYWGKLQGISDINAPLRLSVTPFVSTYYEHAPIENNNINTKYNNLFSYNFGADLKYGIDEKFTMDLTLLPDFNQVQSDNKVKNIGYQEITYDEKRAFLKEGVELFNKNQMFYSRRIGKTPTDYDNVESQLSSGEKIISNPSKVKLLNAIKLSGRNNNGLGMGFFNAITDNMYAEIEDSAGNKRKIRTEPLTNYNIIVFDQQLKNNSSIYFINTNVWRNTTFEHANLTSSGYTLENKSHTYATDFYGIFSQKYSKNDSLSNTYDVQTGYRYFAGVRKISGNFQCGYSHSFVNKTFDSRDMGYLVFGNTMKEKFYAGYYIFNPTNWFRESYSDFSYNHGINPETNKIIQSNINFSQYITLLNYSAINFYAEATPFVFHDYYEPRVNGRYSRGFRYYMANISYDTDARKNLRMSFRFTFGDFLERYEGKYYGINSTIKYRISNRFNVRYDFSFADDNYNIGFADLVDDNIIYGGRRIKTWENIFNIQYLFMNDMDIIFSARHYWNSGNYTHYYNLLENGDISETFDYQNNANFSYNVFNIDVSYSWKFAPGSIVSIVYKNYIETDESEINKSVVKNFKNTINSPQTNSISLKLLYYLDYQNIISKKKV